MSKNPTDQRNQQTGNQSNQRTRQDGNKETNPNNPKANNPNDPKANNQNDPKGDPTKGQQEQGSGKTEQPRDENSPASRKNPREFPVTEPVEREMDDITANDDQMDYDSDDQDNDQDTDQYEDDDDAGTGRTSTDPGRRTV